MAINPQAREAVLRQMSEVPELRGGLAQMAGHSANAAKMSEEFKRLNPKGYNRYNPNLAPAQGSSDPDNAGWIRYHSDPDLLNQVLSSESYKDLGQQGLVGGTKHGDDEQIRRLATARLYDVGITDMDQVGYTAGPDGNLLFYDKVTGRAIPSQLKGVKDRGQTNFYFNVRDDGSVTLDDYFLKDTRRSGLGKIAPGFTNPIVSTALGIGAGFLAPGLGAALGSAMGGGTAAGIAGSALAGAGLGGLHAGITGGDIGKSMLLGGVGGGLSQYLKGADFMKNISSPVLKSATQGALVGGAKGALGAGLYGGNIGAGALSGGLTGGLGGAGGAAFGGDPNTLIGKAQGFLGSQLGSRVGGQLANNLVGSPFDRMMQRQAASAQQSQMQRQQQLAQQQRMQSLSYLPEHAQAALLGLSGGVA